MKNLLIVLICCLPFLSLAQLRVTSEKTGVIGSFAHQDANFSSDNRGELWGLYVYSKAFTTSTNPRIGIYNLTDHNTNYQQIGIKNKVDIQSTSSATSYGILNDAYLYGSGGLSAAIYSRAWTNSGSSGSKIGIYSGIDTTGTGIRYAIYGTGGDYAGYFHGDVVVTGTFTNSSDRDLKEDIKDVEDPVEKFVQIKARTYTLKKDKDKKIHYGFIAQEMETLFPDLVKEFVQLGDPIYVEQEDEDGETRMVEAGRAPEVTYKGINYIELMPILVKVIQQQENKISDLEARIEQLEKK